VSITVARDVTEHVKAPRAVFVPFRMGHHFGVPFHRALQRRIILAALGHVRDAKVSGEVLELGITWAQARREAAQLAPNGKTA
jgi:hypothetical protein